MVQKLKRNLPFEIVSNILSRLPVKSLIRFSLVHKPWYSLISDPYFVNMHLQNHKEKDNLLVLQSTENDINDIVVADTCSNELSMFKRPHPPPYNYDLVDSCNGLVCIHGQTYFHEERKICDKECIILWNPALRINKIIRHRRMSTFRLERILCVGFGFHKQSNDYKVIRFTNDLSTCRLKGVKVYSLSTNSWRNIKGAVDSLGMYSYCVQFGVYVSDAPLIPNFYGAFCWLAEAFFEAEHIEARIISFDMKEEVFKEITLPPTLSFSQGNDNVDCLRLFNCKESLGVLERVGNPMVANSVFCDVWLMKEYNKPESWTKLYKFEEGSFFDLTLLEIARETELILMTHYLDRNEVHVLDIDKLEINTSSTKDINILKTACCAVPFSESLLLLDAKNKKTCARH